MLQAKGPRGTHKAFKVMRKKAVRFKSLTEEPPLQAFKFVNVVPIARDFKKRGDPSKFKNKNMKEGVVLRHTMQTCAHVESLPSVLSCNQGDIPAHFLASPASGPFCMR